MGSRPSATWRGIMKARCLFEKGLRIRIGNGQATRIWGTSWIPEDGYFKILTPQPLNSLYPDRVADLIDPITRTWRVDVVNDIFWPVDRERILAIPIGALEVEDRLVWHFTNDGKFSVKSCYHFVKDSCRSAETSHRPSGSGSSERKWSMIWSMKLPPKIRMFVWRACSNILPTKLALYRRHAVANPFCDRCGLEVESTTHVLFVCREFQEVWTGQPFNLGSFDPQETMWAVLEVLKKRLLQELFLDAIILCWKIWEIRNKEIHGSMEDLPTDIMTWVRDFRTSYEAAQIGDTMARETRLEEEWHPPEPGITKINVDVALPLGQDFFRVGLVARNSEGQVEWWRVKTITGRPSPLDGEALAVYHGVLLARDIAWNQVIVETDCLQVFLSLSCSSSSRSFISFGALLDACLADRVFFS